MAMYPPLRSEHSEQLPYSSVQDNSSWAASDIWGDLAMGRLMLFAKLCDKLVGSLMGSIHAFVTQKDVDNEEG